MFKGGLIIFVAILSKIFFKRKLKLENYTGIFLVLIGIIVVGKSNLS